MLTRQERFDLALSRRLPRVSRGANRWALRVSGGRIGSRKRGIPIALVTTTGRRSGRERTVPLMYMEDAGRLLVVASNAGFDPPPAWFQNLLAHPRARVERRGERFDAVAEVLPDAERDRLWPRLVAHNPLWDGFQSHTERRLEVVALSRAGAGAPPRP